MCALLIGEDVGDMGEFQNWGMLSQVSQYKKQRGGKKKRVGKKSGAHSIEWVERIFEGCRMRGEGSIKTEKVTRKLCESIMTVRVS